MKYKDESDLQNQLREMQETFLDLTELNDSATNKTDAKY